MSSPEDALDVEVLRAITAAVEGYPVPCSLDPAWLAETLRLSYDELDRSLTRLEESGVVEVYRHALPRFVKGYETSQFYPMQASSVTLRPSPVVSSD